MGGAEPLLRWTIELSEEERKQLFNRETITKEAHVNFKGEGGLNLWPRERSGIVVRPNALGGMLIVDYTQWVNGMIDFWEAKGTGSYVDSTFTCSWNELPKSSAGVIYQDGATNHGGLDYRETQKQPLKLKISLDECKASGDKQKAECNLKVTTSKN